MSSPVSIEILWDDKDLELRAMKAIMTVFEVSKLDGMDREAQRRVAGYISERLGTPTIAELLPIQPLKGE